MKHSLVLIFLCNESDVKYIFPNSDNGNYRNILVIKKALVLTLFLIGAGLSRDVIKTVGVRPMILGVILWIFIAVSTLVVIKFI